MSPSLCVLFAHIIFGVMILDLDPREVNVMITAITNYFYTTLSKEDFVCLSIILRELSKTMISTSIYLGLCADDKDKKD